MTAVEKIPIDDAETLRSTLEDVVRTDDTQGLIDLVVSLILRLSSDNKRLAERLDKLLRNLHGRKSEKLDPAQLLLFANLLSETEAQNGEDEKEPEPAPDPKPKPKPDGKPKKGHGRNKFPKNLERVDNITPVPEADRICSVCGTLKICIGHTVSERLDYVPAHFRVIRDMSEKMACKPCQGSISVAPSATRLIEGGLATESILAHVLVSKYIDGLTLTRLRKIYARSGVHLAESTLGDFVRQTTMHLAVVSDYITKQVLQSYCINQDDTGIRVLDKDHPSGIRRGHIYANVGDGVISYQYAPNLKGEHPREFLRGYCGVVQGDGYAGINKLFGASDSTATRAGCMMHTRRYFFEAHKAGDRQAGIALAFIGQLYNIEAQAKKDGLQPEERQQLRQQRSMPIMQRLEEHINSLKFRVAPKTELGRALTYASNQWPALLVPFNDGRLEIDNSEAERQLKVLAIGRKNWLFAGSDAGGERAATALTVLATAVWQGVDPLAYLTSILQSIAEGIPSSRVAELLPMAWAEKYGQQVRTQASALPQLQN